MHSFGATIYQDNNFAIGYDVIKNQDNNFVIAGEKSSHFSWVLECSETEINITEFENDTLLQSSINAINELENGDLIFLGKIYSEVDLDNHNIYLRKTSHDGSLVWEQTLKRSLNDKGIDILTNNDGNLLLCYEWKEGIIGTGIGVIEIDTDGNILKEKRIEEYKESLLGAKFHKTSDGGILIAASQKINLAEVSNPITIKLDHTLDLKWSTQSGNMEYDQFLNGAKELSNGDILVFGSSTDECFEGTNIYIAKLSNIGELK